MLRALLEVAIKLNEDEVPTLDEYKNPDAAIAAILRSDHRQVDEEETRGEGRGSQSLAGHAHSEHCESKPLTGGPALVRAPGVSRETQSIDAENRRSRSSRNAPASKRKSWADLSECDDTDSNTDSCNSKYVIGQLSKHDD